MIQPELKFLGKDVEGRMYECPLCGDTIKVEHSVFYGECPACKATVIDYVPLPHQEAFHKSNTRYRLNLGGYGTGKTTMCAMEVVEHALTTPNGKTLVTGPTLPLVKQAIIPEIDRLLPPKFIAHRTASPISITLTNGHNIVVFASNDEQNLRSLNLTMFYMDEASNIDHKIFVQLQTRLRHRAGFVYGTDELGREVEIANFTKGIVSSNPEQGWLVDEFLLYSENIHASENVDKSGYEDLKRNVNPSFESFLSSSRDNIHLPRDFISEVCIGKSPSWISKYIDCSLEVREGTVYKQFLTSLVDDFPIPKSWKHIIGFDKGIRDPTAWLIGAIDPNDGVIYIYKEYSVPDEPVSYHAKMAQRDFKGLAMYNLPQADPSILQRNDRDARSYQDYFLAISGIYLEPANNSIDAGINKVKDYMHLGKIKFFRSLTATKEEAVGYIWKDKDGKEQPSETNNHLMDCLRYMIVALPQDPTELSTFFIAGYDPIIDYLGQSSDDDDYNDQLGYFGANERWS